MKPFGQFLTESSIQKFTIKDWMEYSKEGYYLRFSSRSNVEMPKKEFSGTMASSETPVGIFAWDMNPDYAYALPEYPKHLLKAKPEMRATEEVTFVKAAFKERFPFAQDRTYIHIYKKRNNVKSLRLDRKGNNDIRMFLTAAKIFLKEHYGFPAKTATAFVNLFNVMFNEDSSRNFWEMLRNGDAEKAEKFGMEKQEFERVRRLWNNTDKEGVQETMRVLVARPQIDDEVNERALYFALKRLWENVRENDNDQNWITTKILTELGYEMVEEGDAKMYTIFGKYEPNQVVFFNLDAFDKVAVFSNPTIGYGDF